MTRYIAFCKIIECGSFTRAAEALGYTQAEVSQMVRSLEKEYALTLLIRTRSGVRLTREGEEIYPLIRKCVSSHRELSERIGELRDLVAGEVRIGAFSSMSQRVLPGLMQAFSRLYPHINFILSPGDNTTMPDRIRQGVIDFGFLYPEAAAGLVSLPFTKDEFLAVFPEGHPYAERASVSLSEMAEEPLILVEEGGVSTVLDAFAEASLTPRVKFRIHDDHTILSMVEQGIGVSILPSMILDRAAYRLKTVPIETPVRRTVSISYLDKELLPLAARRFIRFMLENAGDYLPAAYIAFDKENPNP